MQRTVSGPSSTAKPKTTSSPAAKGTGAKKVTKKPAGEKPKKRSNDSDDDSLQLSDPESDIGDLAAGTSNLDIQNLTYVHWYSLSHKSTYPKKLLTQIAANKEAIFTQTVIMGLTMGHPLGMGISGTRG